VLGGGNDAAMVENRRLEPDPVSRRGFIAVVAAGLTSACVNQPKFAAYTPPVPGLPSLLAEQARIYPSMQAEDIYKLLYQATIGPSNFFIGNESGCLRGLLGEIAKIQPAIHDGEEEFENLCRERGLVRVNLRPYLKRGGKAEELARALSLTTHRYRGEVAELDSSLEASIELIDEFGIGGGREALRKVMTRMRRANHRPSTHSEIYALTYRPAYRVVLREYLTDATYGGRGNVYP
jgi:hypothetical protein